MNSEYHKYLNLLSFLSKSEARDHKVNTLKEGEDLLRSREEELLNECARLQIAVESRISSSTIKPTSYLVGGFVRDTLLGIESKDADLEVYGLVPEECEQIVREVFSGEVIERVGKEYEIIKVEHRGGFTLDISIPRRRVFGENSPFEMGDPEITPEEAAILRDFSCNNFACDVRRMRIFDFNKGLVDLNQRGLRISNPNQFLQVPIRVVRGIQFAARFKLVPDESDFNLMRAMVKQDLLADIHQRRLLEEFRKLWGRGESVSSGLLLAEGLGLLDLLGLHDRRLDGFGLQALDAYHLKLKQVGKVVLSEDANLISWSFFLSLLYESNFNELRRAGSNFLSALGLNRKEIAQVISMIINYHEGVDINVDISSQQSKEKSNNPISGHNLTKRAILASRVKMIPRGSIHNSIKGKSEDSLENSLLTKADRIENNVYPASLSQYFIFRHIISDKVIDSSFLERLEGIAKISSKSIKRKPLVSYAQVSELLSDDEGFLASIILGLIERMRYRLLTESIAEEYLRDNFKELRENAIRKYQSAELARIKPLTSPIPDKVVPPHSGHDRIEKEQPSKPVFRLGPRKKL